MPSTLYFPLLKVNFLVIPGISSLTSPTSFFGFFLGSFQTHALLLNQPGVRYFLPDSSLRLRPDLCKLAADKGTLPRTGQIYT